MQRLSLILLSMILLVACSNQAESTPTEVAENSTALPIIQENPTENVAARVNGEVITITEVETQMAFLQNGGQVSADDQDAIISLALENRIKQKLIEQSATPLGVTVTDEDVQAEIEALNLIAAQQGLSLEEFFVQQGIPATDYPQWIRENLLTAGINAVVTNTVPTTGIQVRARHILVKELTTAQEVLSQLNSGADFVELAAQYSLDPSTRDAGGDLGWISPGDLLQADVEAMIFALPANSRAPEPIQSNLGYHIVESIERAEDRPLDPARIATQRQALWESWLNDRRAEAEIIRYIGPNAEG